MSEKSLQTKDFIKSYRKFLIERADRISTALYLVTSILDNKEPLKWKLRESALKTLSLANKGETEELLLMLSDLSFDISLAQKSALFSPMNAEMLQRAVETFDTKISTQGMLADEYFATTDVTQPVLEKESVGEATPQIAAPISKGQKKEKPATQKPQSNKGQNFSKGQTVSRKQKRRDMVLSALSKKKDQSIKDIAKQVRGCSEKTIQRELNTLIAEGKIEKHGERRWSTYALV